MTKIEKRRYIKRHFSRQCKIVLLDVKKTKYYKDLQRKNKVTECNYGRKKHSCYICFQKFFTKEDLTAHKFIHYSEKSNDTFSDDNEEMVKSPSSSSKEDEQVEGVPIESDSDKWQVEGVPIESDSDKIEEFVKEPDSAEIDETPNPEESECFTKETNYSCLSCHVCFINQVDVKAHIHNQYSCKYFCKQCDRQFNTKGGFIVHVLQHDMINVSKLSYRCNKCPYSFDDCYKLKRHYATAHNVENNSIAESAESFVSSRDDPPVNVDKSNDKLLESKEPTSSTLSTQRHDPATMSSLDKPKNKSNNPITRNIPIFDCDVCYDVFSTEKALKRHKILHRNFEKTSESSKSILIEDDDVQVVQNDDTSNKQSIVSNFTTTHSPNEPKFSTPTPMAKLTPLWSEQISSIPPYKPNILTKQLISNRQDVYATKDIPPMGKNSLEPLNVSIKTGVDKTKITSEITEMLAGRTLPKIEIPRRLLAPQPRLDIQSPRSVLKNPTAPPSKMGQVKTNVKAAPKRTDTSAPVASSNIASGAGQPQYMYVVYPQQSGQASPMPSGGQAVMMIDPSSTITANPTAGFVVKNQGDIKSSTIVPSSGPNQFIINQQINTGGVVINPQAGSVPGSSFVFNQNIEGQSVRVQESSMLQAVSGLQGSEGGQRYYVVIPSNQSGTMTPNIGLSSPNSQVLQQTVTPNMAGVMRQDVSHNFPGLLNKPIQTGSNTEFGNILLNANNPKTTVQELACPQKSKRYYTVAKTPDITIDDSNSYEPTMPIIASVEGESPDERNSESSRHATQGDYSEMVMPIITSIGTVAEESKNVKEKVRKDPVSKYESEFAKFLEKSDGGPTDENQAISDLSKKNFARNKRKVESNDEMRKAESNDDKRKTESSNEATGALKTAIINRSVVSNDEIILLDDNSSSNESIKNLDITPAAKTMCTVKQSKNAEQAKPKIFVKKLSDLLGSSRIAQVPSKYANCRHCCLRCNLQFKDWYDLRIHLKSAHQLHACVYSKCLILNTIEEYQDHISASHHCFGCLSDFGDLRSHKQKCRVNRNSDHDRKTTQTTSAQNSDVSDIFAATGTDVNF